MPKTAIYPGSFDPVTNGHLDIIQRGLEIFDRIIVTILCNPAKTSLFTVEERVEMLQDASTTQNPRMPVSAISDLARVGHSSRIILVICMRCSFSSHGQAALLAVQN